MTLQHWHFSTKPLLLKGICPFRLQWGPQKVASTLSGYYSHCLSHYRSNPEPVQPSLEKSPSAWLTSSLNGAQLTVQHSVKRTWKRLWRKVLHRKDLQAGAMLTKKSFISKKRKKVDFCENLTRDDELLQNKGDIESLPTKKEARVQDLQWDKMRNFLCKISASWWPLVRLFPIIHRKCF